VPDTTTTADPDTQTGSHIDQRPDPVTTDQGDHERFAHYADRDKITEATVLGTPVVALCGKVWVPSRDPSRYPICPDCQRLYDLGPEGRMREWQERASESG
jgi:hypothetical protein